MASALSSIVNFNTMRAGIELLPALVADLGARHTTHPSSGSSIYSLSYSWAP